MRQDFPIKSRAGYLEGAALTAVSPLPYASKPLDREFEGWAKWQASGAERSSMTRGSILAEWDRDKVYSSLRSSWVAVNNGYGEGQTQGRDIALSKLAEH